MYVFLVSNGHICSKFTLLIAILYSILRISEASHVVGLIAMWGKHTVGILLFTNSCLAHASNFYLGKPGNGYFTDSEVLNTREVGETNYL